MVLCAYTDKWIYRIRSKVSGITYAVKPLPEWPQLISHQLYLLYLAQNISFRPMDHENVRLWTSQVEDIFNSMRLKQHLEHFITFTTLLNEEAGLDGSSDLVVARNCARITLFETRPGRIFVIEVVHIQCSKLFKGMECAVLSMVGPTVQYKEPLKSFHKTRAQPRLWASFCRDIAMSVEKATWSNIYSRTPQWGGANSHTGSKTCPDEASSQWLTRFRQTNGDCYIEVLEWWVLVRGLPSDLHLTLEALQPLPILIHQTHYPSTSVNFWLWLTTL